METGRFDTSGESLEDNRKRPSDYLPKERESIASRVIDKGIVFLYSFHALRYQKNPLYTIPFEIPAFGIKGEKYPPPEKFLIDKNVIINHKEAYFARHFRDFAWGIENMTDVTPLGNSPYERIFTTCKMAYDCYNLGEDLNDSSGNTLPIETILPEPEVINEMWNNLVVLRKPSSSALRSFITNAFETNP
jgi:hypothetical protein